MSVKLTELPKPLRNVSLSQSSIFSIFLFVALQIAVVANNAFFHSLALVPSPRLYVMSALPMSWSQAQGPSPHKFAELHENTAPVVRVSPGEVSCAGVSDWRDVYGPRSSKGGPLTRDTKASPLKDEFGTMPLFQADVREHSRLRRQLNPASPKRHRRHRSRCYRYHAWTDISVRYFVGGASIHALHDISPWVLYVRHLAESGDDGSETLATALATALSLALFHPETMARIKMEIRSTFDSEQDITAASLSQMLYLLVVIDESMRLWTLIATSFNPRRVPPGGCDVDGSFNPEGTLIGIHYHDDNRSEAHFRDAKKFVPKRCLGDERYAGNVREAFRPFGSGTLNYIGLIMGRMETRVIAARLIYEFDIGLRPESSD
ncbi:benzoate 4-monooxygenase cytochrome P450 [Xylariaceae sp. FL0662B]|nr:benzoate 4-monooxygenase cytochrome P450 [Xylariaceae sp. FL0662B]